MSRLDFSERFNHFDTNKNVHNCKRCPYFSTSIFLIINHVRTHRALKQRFDCEKNSLEIYYCTDCDFHTNLTIHFKKHVKEHHNRNQSPNEINSNEKIKRYFCANCNFETFFSLKWLQHVKDTCLKLEKSKAKSKSQRKTTSKSEQKKKWHQCDQCEYGTTRKSHLHRHTIWKHLKDDEITWYPCLKCSYKAKNKCRLTLHVQNCHLDEKYIKWHHCDQCSYKTKLAGDIRTHKICKHMIADEVTWYYCYHCMHATKFKGSLRKHLQTVHGPKKSKPRKARKPNSNKSKTVRDTLLYECEKCPLIFAAKYSLKMHVIRKHGSDEDVKWYDCDQCSYKAGSAADVKSHKISRHLKDDEISWFRCTTCVYKAKLKNSLTKHIRRVHTLKEFKYVDDPLKPCRCEKCPIRFKNKQDLARHIIDRHTDEKDILWFECNQCMYRSKRSDALKQHKMRLHDSGLQIKDPPC